METTTKMDEKEIARWRNIALHSDNPDTRRLAFYTANKSEKLNKSEWAKLACDIGETKHYYPTIHQNGACFCIIFVLAGVALQYTIEWGYNTRKLDISRTAYRNYFVAGANHSNELAYSDFEKFWLPDASGGVECYNHDSASTVLAAIRLDLKKFFMRQFNTKTVSWKFYG